GSLLFPRLYEVVCTGRREGARLRVQPGSWSPESRAPSGPRGPRGVEVDERALAAGRAVVQPEDARHVARVALVRADEAVLAVVQQVVVPRRADERLREPGLVDHVVDAVRDLEPDLLLRVRVRHSALLHQQ